MKSSNEVCERVTSLFVFTISLNLVFLHEQRSANEKIPPRIKQGGGGGETINEGEEMQLRQDGVEQVKCAYKTTVSRLEKKTHKTKKAIKGGSSCKKKNSSLAH